ncbi:MAG: hypothetical protein ABR552_03495 [Actinomycetota bacterium]
MSWNKRTRALVACAVLAGALGVGAPAHATSGGIVIASRASYVPGDNRNHTPVVTPHGSTLTFTNLDPASFLPHTLTADALDPTCTTDCPPPAFDSGQLNFKDSVTLDVSTLPGGVYHFHCNNHIDMHGTLCIESPEAPDLCSLQSS